MFTLITLCNCGSFRKFFFYCCFFCVRVTFLIKPSQMPWAQSIETIESVIRQTPPTKIKVLVIQLSTSSVGLSSSLPFFSLFLPARVWRAVGLTTTENTSFHCSDTKFLKSSTWFNNLVQATQASYKKNTRKNGENKAHRKPVCHRAVRAHS